MCFYLSRLLKHEVISMPQLAIHKQWFQSTVPPRLPPGWPRRIWWGHFFRTRTLCPIFPPFLTSGPEPSQSVTAQTRLLVKKRHNVVLCGASGKSAGASQGATGAGLPGRRLNVPCLSFRLRPDESGLRSIFKAPAPGRLFI